MFKKNIDHKKLFHCMTKISSKHIFPLGTLRIPVRRKSQKK